MLTSVCVFAGILGAPQASAQDASPLPVSDQRSARYVVEAPVVRVEPVIETRVVSRPERVCAPVQATDRSRQNISYRYPNDRYERERPHYERRERRRATGARIIGGLIGGAVGNQFGGGNGRKALTIAGALMGSAIAGGRAERRYEDRYVDRDGYYQRRYYEPEYECRTTHAERTVEDVVGYDVTYRYNNQLYTRRQDSSPGDTIRLRVSAVPDVAT